MRESLLPSLVEHLQRLPRNVAQHPGLLVHPTLEGYRDFTFGAGAGPASSVEYLFHELAHAVQFCPESFLRRACYSGFQFKLRSRWVFDRICVEPHTNQMTRRELETFAIQARLLESVGYAFDRDAFFTEHAETLCLIMPDWVHTPGRSDKARVTSCVVTMNRHHRAQDVAATIARLHGWLDATHARLRRRTTTEISRAYLLSARYRGDGSLDVSRPTSPAPHPAPPVH